MVWRWVWCGGGGGGGVGVHGGGGGLLQLARILLDPANSVIGELIVALRQLVRWHPLLQLDIRREAEVMRDCQHPNVVELYDVFEGNTFSWVVTEECAGGDLYNDKLRDKGVSKFSQILSVRYPAVK